MNKGSKHTEENKKIISEKMKGNKNAEVWDEKLVLIAMEKIQKHLEENENEYTLVGSLIGVGLYPDWWADMSRRYSDVNSVIRAIKKIEGLIERRIVNNTMVGDAKSAAFSIFLLKNKFGYVDKQESDNTHKITGVDLKSAISFDDENSIE